MDSSTEEEDYMDIKYDDNYTDLLRKLPPPHEEHYYNVWDDFFIHISDTYTLEYIFSHMDMVSLLNLRKTNKELSKLIKEFLSEINDTNLIISIKKNYINYFNKRYENDKINNIYNSIKDNYINKPIILPDDLINDNMIWYVKIKLIRKHINKCYKKIDHKLNNFINKYYILSDTYVERNIVGFRRRIGIRGRYIHNPYNYKWIKMILKFRIFNIYI